MKAVIHIDGLTSVPAKVDFATDPNLTESWLQHALFDAPHADALNDRQCQSSVVAIEDVLAQAG